MQLSVVSFCKVGRDGQRMAAINMNLRRKWLPSLTASAEAPPIGSFHRAGGVGRGRDMDNAASVEVKDHSRVAAHSQFAEARNDCW